MIDARQVFFTTTINYFDILEMPKDELESMVNGQLSRGLADYITEHIKELPVITEISHQFSTYRIGGEKHMIRVNLISDEELLRLQNIEYEYNKFMCNERR